MKDGAAHITSAEELALQRKRYAHLSDEEFRFMLQQVDGRQRTQSKLPTFAAIDDWWYPVRLSCEQCSSEATARYKAQLLARITTQPSTLVDLTGGYGVDTYFMSEHMAEAHYVEQNAELCRIATHNFAHTRPQISIHNTSAEAYLSMPTAALSNSIFFIDPARRDAHGGKVFRIEDCEPNLLEILPIIRQHTPHIIIKLSPMIDLSSALHSLGGRWDVHVVAVNNEVKEVLLQTAETQSSDAETHTYAVNILHERTDSYHFTREAESQAQCSIVGEAMEQMQYLYEPNAAIIKAGAFKSIAQAYKLSKLDSNTHLYAAETMVENFPGRVWKIIAHRIKDAKSIHAHGISRTAIITRNYPLTPEQVRKKFKVQDDDTYYLIGARIAQTPTLLLAQRVR